MIDTHAHLDACPEQPDVLLARAVAAGVQRVLAVGSGLASCRHALALTEGNDGVYAVLGIHPHQSGDASDADVDELRELLRHPRAVAVGETGLDFFRDYAPRDRQLQLFQHQLELAAETRKPVVVHTRDAGVETARELEPFAGTVILHCFSSPDLLSTALERGYYVSFAGNVTYPKADDLRAAAEQVPSDRLLVETDTPYLAPQERRGRPNEPANVIYTLRALADVRGEDVDVLEARIDANATDAFSLS